jgi:hypothetical protein
VLADGTYDAFVIDAEEIDGGGPGSLRVEITVTSGEHKGEVVAVRGSVAGRSALDLLGLPVTLVVDQGSPRLHLD